MAIHVLTRAPKLAKISRMAAPLITTTGTPAKARYCGFIHGECLCPPHPDLLRVWTGDEWEWTPCLCASCTEAVAVR